eukprot:TRINITY_DN10645_c0_g2_i1.p1 TRINITY_DN10645_c0_g2~~TRINITY_DN10645_c0_g2_i1.p1  ORF type:complete len:162 (+),score=19.45 TRINITY_DN10645_c0_g2_i1:65-550(+)
MLTHHLDLEYGDDTPLREVLQFILHSVNYHRDFSGEDMKCEEIDVERLKISYACLSNTNTEKINKWIAAQSDILRKRRTFIIKLTYFVIEEEKVFMLMTRQKRKNFEDWTLTLRYNPESKNTELADKLQKTLLDIIKDANASVDKLPSVTTVSANFELTIT